MSSTTHSTSVTGRDSYIRNQALLYAIAHIQSLPEEKQEFSNMCDMCALLLADQNAFTFGQIMGVEQHTGIKIDLWPVEVEGYYSAEQLAQKSEWEAFIDQMRAMFAQVAVELENRKAA